jgi:hypothetical protein
VGNTIIFPPALLRTAPSEWGLRGDSLALMLSEKPGTEAVCYVTFKLRIR